MNKVIGRRALLAGIAATVIGRSLGADAASFLPLMPRASGVTDLQYVPYKTNWGDGIYGVWANNWSMNWGGPFPWVEGVDFYASWNVRTNSFPDRTECNWFLPHGPPPNGVGVWGYYLIGYGNYDSGVSVHPSPPLQICNITDLHTNFDFSWTGDVNWNMLHELFLTRKSLPTGDISAVELLEVSFFIHASPNILPYQNSGVDLGTHTNNGVTYHCGLTYGSTLPYSYYAHFLNIDNNAAFYSPRMTGVIDWKAVFDFLLSKGVITGSEWVNGIAIGNEPGGTPEGPGTRTGQFYFHDFAMTWEGSTGAPGADYLGTNIFTDGNGMGASWALNELTATTGQADPDGGTNAVLLSETTANAMHYYTLASAVTVPNAAGDYIWLEDIKTVGRNMVIAMIGDGSFTNQIAMRFDLTTELFHASIPDVGTGLQTVQLEDDTSKTYHLTMECIAIGGAEGFHRILWRFRKAAGITSLNFRLGTCLGNFDRLLIDEAGNHLQLNWSSPDVLLTAPSTAADYTFVGDPAKGIIVRPRHRLVSVS